MTSTCRVVLEADPVVSVGLALALGLGLADQMKLKTRLKCFSHGSSLSNSHEQGHTH